MKKYGSTKFPESTTIERKTFYTECYIHKLHKLSFFLFNETAFALNN